MPDPERLARRRVERGQSRVDLAQMPPAGAHRARIQHANPDPIIAALSSKSLGETGQGKLLRAVRRYIRPSAAPGAEIFTTKPPLRSRMCGMAARVSMNGGGQVHSENPLPVLSDKSSADPGTPVPAALTRTETLPSWHTARSTISPKLAACARSGCIGRARTPLASIWSHTLSRSP